MKVLLVGGGGREHALAWRLAQSEKCAALYCAPGNAGIADCAECVAIAADDVDALTAFAIDHAIDLVVAGPEAPLVAGLADALKQKNIKVFGCSAAAARLEGSKGFMKDLCAKYGVPTAAYGRFSEIDKARAFIEKHGAPIVIKADGLAAGKGVIIAQTIDEAVKAAEDMLSGDSFGSAGSEIVIEEFLDGEELSFFAIADGNTYAAFGSAQDHKRAFDGDKGPNTGGMGAYSPAHLMNEKLGAEIEARLIKPIIDGLRAEGAPFTGVLFAGVMVVDGTPYVLEYNVRFGDPECQALMMRLQTDLLDILDACASGTLADAAGSISWRDEAALCVVMAANGYPGPYEKNTAIQNLAAADILPDVKIFHAGTKKDESGQILACGGRVLGVTAHGATIENARDAAYRAVDTIGWPGGFCRRDIGWRALADKKEIKKISTSC